MAPGMSVARRPLPVSPVSFKPQPKNESARSSTPYRIYSKRKITNLPLKPTLHQAKPFGKPLIGYAALDDTLCKKTGRHIPGVGIGGYHRSKHSPANSGIHRHGARSDVARFSRQPLLWVAFRAGVGAGQSG